MKCREAIDDVRTGELNLPWEQRRRCLFCGRRDIRHRGGVSPVRAQAWNLGTCRLDAKGDVQADIPQGPEYRCGAQGRNDP